jgi:ferredoxin
MITAERKLFDQIKESTNEFGSLLVLGCGTCVSVCMTGGEKEVGLLASELRIKNRLDGRDVKIGEATVQRQCDREFIVPILETARKYDAVLSMACGAGVQLVAEMLEPMRVIPALNTRFIGITQEEGVWAERCRACGNCVLADYGGICPITICAKSLINGPCGGSKGGKCEASNEKDCAWVLIYNRLKKQNRLDNIFKMFTPKDYSTQAHPAQMVNEAYSKVGVEEKHGK